MSNSVVSERVTARISGGEESIHISGVVGVPPEQRKPDSNWHYEEQPSPLRLFPSSHS